MKIFRLALLGSSVKGNCYDGNNGGCSHFCGGAGECSCPPCWSLDEAGKSCSIEAGKATVTCSSTGVSISIDKCVVPGVDAAALHLNDDSCAAVADGDTHWTIESSSVTGCGATASFEDNVFKFANTLHIGNSVVNNVVSGRNAEVGYVCNYNSEVTAVSNYASRNLVSSVSFDAGDVNNNIIDFVFTFSFYETPAYETPIDYSTKQTAVGNLLYGKIDAPAMIPDTAFVVKKCSVTDAAVEGSNLDLVENNCPIENGLGFTWGETTATDVKFQFMSFIFPDSANTADMTLTCDISFCSADDADCLASCNSPSTETVSSNPSDVHILMISGNFPSAFVTSGDGLVRAAATISAPENTNLVHTAHAIVKGELYIFGGSYALYRIIKLSDCASTELSLKLNYPTNYWSAAISIDNESRALICFSDIDRRVCQIFDTLALESTHSTTYQHGYGKLGLYKGQPTVVGGKLEKNKVETYSPVGWSSLADFTSGNWAHALVGLPDGSLCLLGGDDDNTGIWLLKENTWASIGTLLSGARGNTAIIIGNSIYNFDGESQKMIERIDLDGNTIVNQKVIGEGLSGAVPVVMQVSADFCV